MFIFGLMLHKIRKIKRPTDVGRRIDAIPK